MNPLIEERREQLEELCRRYGVQRLEVFGSAAGDRFDLQRSELDFLVVFTPTAAAEHGGRYFGLLEALQDLFARDIDLIELSAIRNPYFRQGIESSRTVVYAA